MKSTSMVQNLLEKREAAMQKYIRKMRETGNNMAKEERRKHTREIAKLDMEIEQMRMHDRI